NRGPASAEERTPVLLSFGAAPEFTASVPVCPVSGRDCAAQARPVQAERPAEWPRTGQSGRCPLSWGHPDRPVRPGCPECPVPQEDPGGQDHPENLARPDGRVDPGCPGCPAHRGNPEYPVHWAPPGLG